jgi:hypothetical protein
MVFCPIERMSDDDWEKKSYLDAAMDGPRRGSRSC